MSHCWAAVDNPWINVQPSPAPNKWSGSHLHDATGAPKGDTMALIQQSVHMVILKCIFRLDPRGVNLGCHQPFSAGIAHHLGKEMWLWATSTRRGTGTWGNESPLCRQL